MRTFPLRRVGAGLGVATATALAIVAATPFGVAAAPSPTHTAAARDAATWLAGEYTDGVLPGPFTPEDWGLSIDGVIALAATGVAGSTRQAATAQIAAHVRSYNSYDDWGLEGFTDGGATAKLLYVASAAGADPTDFGGWDLRAETVALIAAADTDHQHGRITSRTTEATGPDPSNTFDQSFAVLGLARSGGAPQETVNFLVRQQCTAGGFRLYPDADGAPSPSCDTQANATLDVDSTAMAVQALLATDAAGADEAAQRGADWLVAQQRADGSFGGSGPTSGPNSNSTGLAGQALAAAGRDAEAARAAESLAALQLTTANGGAAAADAGAIAYASDALTEAVADGIADTFRDQWRRATAQALLGLAQVPLSRIGLDVPPSGEPTPSVTVPPTPTASSSPTGSPSPSASPTPTTSLTSSPTPSASPSSTPSVPTTAPTPAPSVTSPAAGGSGRLPTTGAAIGGYVLIALLLLGGGVVLLLLGRRRAT
ncbi:terpene cyclase/mutase family protein [Verrucosispora sp. CWR15]|uniref:Terpene cyclase/mutase family protein n=1 Tax=Verrucosispora sioxanthis TaxID=2499994 RepID=A0A6M1KXE8_9ACTN|nr:prenyltransferase/squalene oxidase repeat-containing protein [Verrucosispora sioxanthis]NEE64466.1 terpene cyclase/mutase family protein [Verrucosispora sioxanthis]NGM13576.1 terpene cyclase/mutase family protein [Verrucosispora sioxanthis]